MELEISQRVIKALDDNKGECSLGEDSDFDDDSTRVVTPGTHN
jgi:hypothetical protein